MALRTLILLLMSAALLAAQQRTSDDNLRTWAGYFGDHPVSDKWGVHVDVQGRRDFLSDWRQYVVRPAANFELSDSVTLTAGYFFGETSGSGDNSRVPEHRLYEQATVRHDVSERLSLSQRYRLEQRFNGSMDPDAHEIDYRYQNRFRYQLGANTPLGDSGGKWYLHFSGEVLANFGPGAASVFDQNRVYAGLGRKTGRWGSVEAGYLRRWVPQSGEAPWESHHTLQLFWLSSASLRGRPSTPLAPRP